MGRDRVGTEAALSSSSPVCGMPVFMCLTSLMLFPSLYPKSMACAAVATGLSQIPDLFGSMHACLASAGL